MEIDNLVAARKMAESAVAGMQEGPLKVAAFETILRKLLEADPAERMTKKRGLRISTSAKSDAGHAVSSGTTARIVSLMDEKFFGVQRSLPEIQGALAERGWHYEQNYLSTPLTRLVRKRVLRRTQTSEGAKKVWKYSIY
jgi:hypothetical protein